MPVVRKEGGTGGFDGKRTAYDDVDFVEDGSYEEIDSDTKNAEPVYSDPLSRKERGFERGFERGRRVSRGR